MKSVQLKQKQSFSQNFRLYFSLIHIKIAKDFKIKACEESVTKNLTAKV